METFQTYMHDFHKFRRQILHSTISCFVLSWAGLRDRELSHNFFAGSHNAKKKSTAKNNRITHAGSPGSIVDLSHNCFAIKYWRIWIGIVRQSVIYSKSWFRTCDIIDFYCNLHDLTSCSTSEYWFSTVFYSIWWVAAHHNIDFLL